MDLLIQKNNYVINSGITQKTDRWEKCRVTLVTGISIVWTLFTFINCVFILPNPSIKPSTQVNNYVRKLDILEVDKSLLSSVTTDSKVHLMVFS